MDYKELLIKYIGHIIDREGIDYTNQFDNSGNTVSVTEEEMTELEALAQEARKRFNS